MLGSKILNKKIILEIKGKGQMPLENYLINPRDNNGRISGDPLDRIWALRVFPKNNPITNPLHQIFANAKQTWDDIVVSFGTNKRKDVPTLYEIPEVTIVLQGIENGKAVSFPKYQLFRVKVYEIYRPLGERGGHIPYYDLKITSYLESDHKTHQLKQPKEEAFANA